MWLCRRAAPLKTNTCLWAGVWSWPQKGPFAIAQTLWHKQGVCKCCGILTSWLPIFGQKGTCRLSPGPPFKHAHLCRGQNLGLIGMVVNALQRAGGLDNNTFDARSCCCFCSRWATSQMWVAGWAPRASLLLSGTDRTNRACSSGHESN